MTAADLRSRIMRSIDASGDCWLWTKSITNRGYGRISVHARWKLAHRIAYEIFIGPIPADLEIDHTCHNRDLTCPGGPRCLHRRCVNPAHLEPATGQQNTLRGRSPSAIHARKTHCPAGHPYDEANTVDRKRRTSRDCKTCHRLRAERDRRDAGVAPARRTDEAVRQRILDLRAAGRTMREIGEAVGLNPGTVSRLLRRAAA